MKNKYITQDCIAREIAAKYGMTEQYEAAKRSGVSPMEALKVCHMMTEEDRKLIETIEKNEDMKNDNENYQKTNTILTLVLAFISFVALVFSGIASCNSIRYTKMVGSKEYQMSEDLKYELLKMVTTLKSIESKVVVSPFVLEDIDFSEEVESISNLRTSPGYMLILHSIDDEESRFMLDLNMLLLTNSIHSKDPNKTRLYIHNCLDVLKEKTNPEFSRKIDVVEMVKEFSDMSIIAPEFEQKESERDVIFQMFVRQLVEVKKNTDPDILLFYGVFTNNKELSEKAILAGADTRVTDLIIIERYADEYDNFVISFKQSIFKDFLKYLIDEKGNKDIDVFLFYSVYQGDTVSLRKAIDMGGNAGVTNAEIIAKYREEYDEFLQDELKRIKNQ